MSNIQENQVPTPEGLPFNWDALPVARTLGALERLGIALLDHLIDGKEPPSTGFWAPFVWTEDEIKQVFPGMDAFPHQSVEPSGLWDRTLGLLHTQIVDKPALSRQKMRLRRKQRGSADTWQPLLKHTLNGYVSSGMRGRIMTHMLAHRFYGPDAYLLPTYLWRTLGRIAFRQPTFMAHVARKIQKYLRNKVVIDPAAVPPIQLSPNTLWLLIALYRPPQPSFFRRLLPKWRAHKRLIETLVHVAQIQARSTGWADFWDQWVLLHALHRDPQWLKRLDPLLMCSLPQLPLLAATTLKWPAPGKDATEETGMLNLAHGNYRQQGPGWLFQLYESHMWEVSTGV